jgi:ATP-dependent Clp protease adaptor protein ClpS
MSAASIQTPQIQTEKPQLKKPPMYKVIMLNDDYTPMDFVVELLALFFQHDESAAQKIMMQIHTQGSAVCGVYPRDIAESKVARVEAHSRAQGHPLQCEIEPQAED